MDSIFSIAQVADRYAVNQDTVRAWITAGLMPAIDTARPTATRHRWRMTPDHLAEFERRRSSSQPDGGQPKRRRTRREKPSREYV